MTNQFRKGSFREMLWKKGLPTSPISTSGADHKDRRRDSACVPKPATAICFRTSSLLPGAKFDGLGLSLEQAGRGAYDAPRWRVPSRQKEHNMHSTEYAHQLKNGEWEVIVDRHDSITRKLFHEQVPQIGFYRIQRKTGSP